MALPKARRPQDRHDAGKKAALLFDIRPAGSTLELIRMPLTAPSAGFA
jgi:hypothetical protein